MALSQDYYDKDLAHTRKPVEIYKFWNDSLAQYWYFTSADAQVVYPATNGSTYEQAFFKRGKNGFKKRF